MVENKRCVLRPVVTAFWISVISLVATGRLCAQSKFSNADYRKADSCAQALKGHSIDDLRVLADKLTGTLDTDVEKFRAIFTWVSLNIENDHNLFLENKRNREKYRDDPDALKAWNSRISEKALRTLIEKRRTVCAGYAYLVRKLALHVEIPCEIIHGYGRTVESNIGGPGIPNHSWNAVRLNDEWHVCDPTWASGAYDRERREFVSQYEPSYFLAAPELFMRNHYPLDTTWMLMAGKPTLREFLDGPIIYVNAFRSGVHPKSPATLNVEVRKGDTVAFSFSGPEGLEKKLRLVVGQNEGNALARVTPAQNGRSDYVMTRRFQRKGTYSVHVIGAGGPVMTYRVVVK